MASLIKYGGCATLRQEEGKKNKKYKFAITLFLFLNPSHRVTQDRWDVLSPSHELIYLFNTSYTLFLTAEASKRHPLEKSHWWESSSHQPSDRSGWKQPQKRWDLYFFFFFSPPFPVGFWNKKAILFLQHQLRPSLCVQNLDLSVLTHSPAPSPHPSNSCKVSFSQESLAWTQGKSNVDVGLGLGWFFLSLLLYTQQRNERKHHSPGHCIT